MRYPLSYPGYPFVTNVIDLIDSFNFAADCGDEQTNVSDEIVRLSTKYQVQDLSTVNITDAELATLCK